LRAAACWTLTPIWHPQAIGYGIATIPKNWRLKMFLVLFIVLLVAWATGFLAFHVAGALIHLLLILAVISLIVHFFRGAGAGA
jgi:hypothetical protein